MEIVVGCLVVAVIYIFCTYASAKRVDKKFLDLIENNYTLDIRCYKALKEKVPNYEKMIKSSATKANPNILKIPNFHVTYVSALNKWLVKGEIIPFYDINECECVQYGQLSGDIVDNILSLNLVNRYDKYTDSFYLALYAVFEKEVGDEKKKIFKLADIPILTGAQLAKGVSFHDMLVRYNWKDESDELDFQLTNDFGKKYYPDRINQYSKDGVMIDIYYKP